MRHEAAQILRRMLPYILTALISALLTGTAFHLRQSGQTGELAARYALQQRNAEQTLGRLEQDLGRERTNTARARTIIDGLTGTTDRNVRNLSEAIGLIREIRAQLKVLEDLYADRDTGDGGD